MRKARSRIDTRSAVLSYLWCSGGSFRPSLAENVGLTEASVSRIVAELKAESVVDEMRRTAPYQGGPSVFITLSQNVCVGVLELSNNRIHAAVGTLSGEILSSARHSLPDGLDAPAVDAALSRAVTELAEWTRRSGIAVEQLAVSIPGYHPDRSSNPILALEPTRLARRLDAAFPGVPAKFANSMVTRAVAHRLHIGPADFHEPYLFVFTGHGVGAAFVEDFAASASVEPCEIGHMVVDVDGPRCRCGHSGCLETYVSTAALADILKIQEADLIARGDRWAQEFNITARARREIQARLARLGTAIGNTLNVSRCRRVVVTGWPSALPGEDRAALLDAVGGSLLGGSDGIDIAFAPASLGREPASGLALATFSFIQRGGARLLPRDEAGKAIGA